MGSYTRTCFAGTSQIAIITWRGTTDAERGFIDTIEESGIDARLNIFPADQDLEVLGKIIQQLQSQPPDLIYVFGTTAVKEVLKEIKDIPVIYNIVNRPVVSGVIKSWEHSGNNTTGASNQVPVINQLKTLKKIIDFKRLGIIYNPKEHNSIVQVDIVRSYEKELNFKLVYFPIEDVQKIGQVLSGLNKKVDAIHIPADSKIISLGSTISKLINHSQLPSFAASEKLVIHHGILLGLIPNYYQLGCVAAQKALRALKGEAPTDIPSSTLEYFNVAVNMLTAQKINAQIPISLLIIANKIVR